MGMPGSQWQTDKKSISVSVDKEYGSRDYLIDQNIIHYFGIVFSKKNP